MSFKHALVLFPTLLYSFWLKKDLYKIRFVCQIVVWELDLKFLVMFSRNDNDESVLPYFLKLRQFLLHDPVTS